MSRNPRVTGAELIAALEIVGFRVLRIKGSHHFLRHDDGRSTVVPVHSPFYEVGSLVPGSR